MMRTIAVAGEVPYDQYFRSPFLLEGKHQQCATYYVQWLGASLQATLTSFDGPAPLTTTTPVYRLPRHLGKVDVLIFAYPLRPVAHALWLKQLFHPRLCFWDYCDDFYYGKKTLPKVVLTFIWQKMCDRVLVLSPTLLPRFRNSFHWDNASHLSPREGQANAPLVIGTIASLDERFDQVLYERMVDALPQCRFHLHGRIYNYRNRNAHGVRRFQGWLNALSTRANFEYFGPYTADQLQPIVSSFDIGLIPYVDGPLCQHINPDKYYHYTNVGLPVLSSPMPSLVQRSNVRFYGSFEDLLEKVQTIADGRGAEAVSVRFSWGERLVELLRMVDDMQMKPDRGN